MRDFSQHANCKNVYLNFNVFDHKFVFELKDDGIGLNGYNDSDYLGMGLQNIRKRANKIDGKMVVSSEIGVGTKLIPEGEIPQNAG
jgi:signal transduction histidine kinase